MSRLSLDGWEQFSKAQKKTSLNGSQLMFPVIQLRLIKFTHDRVTRVVSLSGRLMGGSSFEVAFWETWFETRSIRWWPPPGGCRGGKRTQPIISRGNPATNTRTQTGREKYRKSERDRKKHHFPSETTARIRCAVPSRTENSSKIIKKV